MQSATRLYYPPCLATMHAELLESAVEHDSNENQLPLPAPLPREANPRIPAAAVGSHLPGTAVPGAKPHVSVRTASTVHTMSHVIVVAIAICKLTEFPIWVSLRFHV